MHTPCRLAVRPTSLAPVASCLLLRTRHAPIPLYDPQLELVRPVCLTDAGLTALTALTALRRLAVGSADRVSGKGNAVTVHWGARHGAGRAALPACARRWAAPKG